MAEPFYVLIEWVCAIAAICNSVASRALEQTKESFFFHRRKCQEVLQSRSNGNKGTFPIANWVEVLSQSEVHTKSGSQNFKLTFEFSSLREWKWTDFLPQTLEADLVDLEKLYTTDIRFFSWASFYPPWPQSALKELRIGSAEVVNRASAAVKWRQQIHSFREECDSITREIVPPSVPLSSIPPDVLLQICVQLNPKDLCSLICSCKGMFIRQKELHLLNHTEGMYKVMQNETLWKWVSPFSWDWMIFLTVKGKEIHRVVWSNREEAKRNQLEEVLCRCFLSWSRISASGLTFVPFSSDMKHNSKRSSERRQDQMHPNPYSMLQSKFLLCWQLIFDQQRRPYNGTAGQIYGWTGVSRTPFFQRWTTFLQVCKHM